MPLSFSASTHTGVRRDSNEDSYCARPDLGLFAVADGVGGYDAGEVASRAAIDAVEQAMVETRGWTEDTTWPFEYQPALGLDGNRLNWALHLANQRIRAEVDAARGRQGMATTIAAIVFDTDAHGIREPVRGATIGHVGDSRVYRWRAGRLDRLTRDHSWVEEQVRAGAMSELDAWRHPRRNLLTRALTGGAEPQADFGWAPLVPGDAVLLCSDGLFCVLSDTQIATILGGDDLAEPRAAANGTVCDALVHAANLAGGPDNITVILVRT
jgi:PPM family protein phosphatase